jgi:hypothetical protein
MNNSRRKELKSVISVLELQKERIDLVTEEEQEARDKLPENLDGSERAEKMEECISNLEDASSDLQDIIDRISELIEN